MADSIAPCRDFVFCEKSNPQFRTICTGSNLGAFHRCCHLVNGLSWAIAALSIRLDKIMRSQVFESNASTDVATSISASEHKQIRRKRVGLLVSSGSVMV